MDSVAPDPSDPERISMAYRGLDEVPDDWISKLSDITVLDLSHNNLSYPFSLLS